MVHKTYILDRAAGHVVIRSRGFTLLEVIVTLAVAAILLGVAVPSYRSVVQRNSVSASVNDLVGDLNYARSEAVTRGLPVYVCASKDQSICSNSSDWSTGWIIFAPDAGVGAASAKSKDRLRVRGALDGQVQITGGDAAITFDANGFAPGSNATFEASADTSSQITEVTIASTGRVDTEKSTP